MRNIILNTGGVSSKIISGGNGRLLKEHSVLCAGEPTSAQDDMVLLTKERSIYWLRIT